jgi:hypothetical protein
MSTAPNLTAVPTEEKTPFEQAAGAIDAAASKLDSLKDLLWLLVELSGLEGGHWASIAYTIEDACDDLRRADGHLSEARP